MLKSGLQLEVGAMGLKRVDLLSSACSSVGAAELWLSEFISEQRTSPFPSHGGADSI